MSKEIDRLFDLSGVTAVVTGGAGVLPGAMATTLAKAGAKISLWDLGRPNPVSEAQERLQSTLKSAGVEDAVIDCQTVDTTDRESVEKALAGTEAAIGKPNLLLNGVGGNRGKSDFVDIDLDMFRSVIEINLVAGLLVPSQVLTRYWITEGIPASIINMASMTSYVPLSGVWAYNAAKSATLNLTQGMAREFAPHGIRVNAIAPGFFVGNQNRALLIANNETGELTERGQSIIDRTPMGRFGSPAELDGVTVFLASPTASGFVTGVCIPVDGGYLVDNI